MCKERMELLNFIIDKGVKGLGLFVGRKAKRGVVSDTVIVWHLTTFEWTGLIVLVASNKPLLSIAAFHAKSFFSTSYSIMQLYAKFGINVNLQQTKKHVSLTKNVFAVGNCLYIGPNPVKPLLIQSESAQHHLKAHGTIITQTYKLANSPPPEKSLPYPTLIITFQPFTWHPLSEVI